MRSIFICFLGACIVIEAASSLGSYDYVDMQYPSSCQTDRNITVGQGGWSRYGFLFVGGCYGLIHCHVILTIPHHYGITLRFTHLHVDRGGSDCLSIDGETQSSQYCGFLTPSHSIFSTGNYFKFDFSSYGYNSSCRPAFSIVYTSFHTGECASDEFRCAIQGRCIPKELTCDSYDNCGDWSDEKYGTCGLSTSDIIFIGVTCALVGVWFIAFFIYCVYYRSCRQKSRHHQEECLGQNTVNETLKEPIPISSVQPTVQPKYAEVPPSYAYIHSNPAFDGVYPTGDSANGVAPPPTYQSCVTPLYETKTCD